MVRTRRWSNVMLWCTGLIVVVVAILMGFYQSLQKDTMGAVVERQAGLARALVNAIADHLEHEQVVRTLILSSVAGDATVLTRGPGLQPRETQGPLALHGPDGTVFLQGPGGPAEPLPRNHAALRGPAGPLLVEGPHFTHVQGVAGVSARYRQIWPGGDLGPRGARAVSQTLRVADLIGSHGSSDLVGKERSVFAMSDDGTLLYHPDREDMVGNNYLQASASCLTCHRDYQLLDQMRTRIEGTGESSVKEGPPRLVNYHRAPIGGGRWISLAISTPRPIALDPSRRAFTFGVVAITLALSLAIVSAWWATRQGRRLDKSILEAATWRERAALLDQIERAKRDWETAFDAIDDLVVMIDAEGAIARVNRAFCRRLGMEAKDIVGVPAPAVFGRLKGPWPVAGHLTPCCPTPQAGVEVHDSSLGETFLVSVSPTPEVGGRAGCVMVARGITELNVLREQMLQSEKLAAVGQLVAGVAHELNNPLSVILGYSELAQEEPPGPELTEMLVIMHRSALRCRKVVDNLLRFARRYRPAVVPTRLNDVIEETLTLLEYELRVANIEVRRDLDPNLPLVLADPHQLQQVFLNLLTNASHALVGAGKPGQITVKSSWKGNGPVSIEVTDTGPGIPEGILEKIFEPFFTTKEAGRGTGLGLMVSRRIIEEAHGRIWATSQPGVGATFSIELPPSDDKSPASEPSTSPAAVTGLAGQRVLLVDDEPANLKLMTTMLQRKGYMVETASDGREALAKILAGSFAAVVTDVRMPGYSGLELYREVQRAKPGFERHFMFVTGDSVTGTTRAELESTGNHWIEKPFDSKVFHSTLALTLDLSR